MAIINVELRMMIAERLANDNYREEIKKVICLLNGGTVLIT